MIAHLIALHAAHEHKLAREEMSAMAAEVAARTAEVAARTAEVAARAAANADALRTWDAPVDPTATGR